MNRKPSNNESPEWYWQYINSLPDGNILRLMEDQLDHFNSLLDPISEEKSLYKYADGKWTIKEIVGHLNDAERILSYRTLRYVREDQTDIPQYDHNSYMKVAKFNSIPFEDLKEEFRVLRKATLFIFKNLNYDAWDFSGTSDGKLFTVRAMAYIITGHVNHHLKILRERYLNNVG